LTGWLGGDALSLDAVTGLPDRQVVRFTVTLALVSTIVAAALFGFTAAATSSAEASAPLYTRAATQACLRMLPNAVAGLPPATPPIPATLFVYALARDDVSTWGVGEPRPRPHTQLGTWYGGRSYEGIILSFFRSAAAARTSFDSLAWLHGGKRIRNVVATWDQKPAASLTVRNAVLGCLRPGLANGRQPNPPPPATLATFTGRWGGHTRGLSITPTGRGREETDDGCCTRVYHLTFQILSVSGTLTRAAAVYRVTAFTRYEAGVRMLRPGGIGKLILKDGIVTNGLTGVFFCSDPAWGATGACGA
jgi:hypothetical protein